MIVNLCISAAGIIMRNKIMILFIVLSVFATNLRANTQYDKWSNNINRILVDNSNKYDELLDSIISNSKVDIEKAVALTFKSKKLIRKKKYEQVELLLDEALVLFSNLNEFKGIGNVYYYKGVISKTKEDINSVNVNYNNAVE
ncbi:hypothetical protein J1N10_20195, partial [Carboxylicivirga sp. A043]|uniref:hypothetical protein n=1 Tax=Carboxylicivirga litoralis TaxID=2816963 RepID=UPI0021CB00B9